MSAEEERAGAGALSAKRAKVADTHRQPRTDHSKGFPSCESPKVTFFVVRWDAGASAGPVSTTSWNWGSANSSVSDEYIARLFDAVWREYGERYTVHTARVGSSEDLWRLSRAIADGDVVPGKVQGQQRATDVVGLYFVWPTCFRDGASACSSSAAGFVEKDAAMQLMQSVEACGVTTLFPHVSYVYQKLLSKTWQAELCLAPQFAIPRTVLVPVSSIRRDPLSAAELALERVSSPSPRCVVKLGYSWEAMDVRVTSNDSAAVAKGLEELTQQTGFFGDCVLVQQYVPAVCELRLFVVNGRVEHVYFCRYKKQSAHGCFQDWEHRQSIDDAATSWFGGDAAPLQDAVHQATQLVDVWLAWFHSLSTEPVPAVRMDFLVALSDHKRVQVTTLELTELGFSMFGWEEGPTRVFQAVVRSATHHLKPGKSPATT